jgi:hypothetical protein
MTIVNFPAQQRQRRSAGPDGITGRDGYIIAQALTYAIATINALPEWRRENSNWRDMEKILRELAASEAEREQLSSGVDGHLHGPYTNLLRKLRDALEDDSTGLLISFVDRAICEYAKEAVKADPEQITKDTNRFINGHAWAQCAQQLLAVLRPNQPA